jgi:hypothetical protein
MAILFSLRADGFCTQAHLWTLRIPMSGVAANGTIPHGLACADCGRGSVNLVANIVPRVRDLRMTSLKPGGTEP